MRYRIDAELRAAAAALPHVDRADVATARRIAASRVDLGPAPADVTIEDHLAGAVPLRVFRPHGWTGGAVVHAHGGGFVLGDLDATHARNVEIARATGAVVVSVGYRLAPEWPYPAPVDDVHTGLEWVHEQRGVDPARVVLHGVSAGGALAAAVALRTTLPVRLLFLASPVLDDRLETTSSRRFTDTPALTRRDLQICWAAYLGSAGPTPADAVPARSPDLARMPLTYISVAEFDPLRDEAVDFARSLLERGVGVELHLFPGTFHGSHAVRGAAVTERQLTEEIDVLRRVLTRCPTS